MPDFSSSNNVGFKKVCVGSKVKVVMPNRSERILVIKTSRESNPNQGIVSYESPIGKALLGTREGDRVSYKVLENTFIVEVLEILD